MILCLCSMRRVLAAARLSWVKRFNEPSKRAEESSPGREPGVLAVTYGRAPEGRQNIYRNKNNLLSPASAGLEISSNRFPGLMPGAIFFRPL